MSRLVFTYHVAAMSALIAVGGALAITSSCRAEGASSSSAVVSPAAELAAKAMQLPAGYHATAVASEPQLQNPVAFCFDPQGRIFVAETHRVNKGVEDNRHHLDWIDDDLAARTVADRKAYVARRKGAAIGEYTSHSDLVRLVEDRDGDGRYEQSSVFSTGYNAVEDGAAAGVLWDGDRLLFTCIPNLWELRDKDGDGKAEEKRSLATGFGVHFALYGHDLHGLVRGPDGKIYFSIGDRGLNVETPTGIVSNPDSGAVLRCNPDGSDLELFATGLRNPQELAFNELGDLFTVDNNSDSGDRARVVYIPEGMQAGWRMSYQYLPDRGPFNREKIWHTQNNEQPASIVPPLMHLGDGPSGVAFYPGTGLPPSHKGAFFFCDFRGAAGTSCVREFWVKPEGATYRVSRDEMFAQGVLATDCGFGPDGALYISDWIDGWNGMGMGRIHRVASDDAAVATAATATRETLARIGKATEQELVKLLAHADMRVRLGAQRRLVDAETRSAKPLAKVAGDQTASLLARLHAIWALGELAEKDEEIFDSLALLLRDDESEVRAQVARILGRAEKVAPQRLTNLGRWLSIKLGDRSPRVQAFAAIAIGRLKYRNDRQPLPELLSMVQNNDVRDPVLRHAIVMGLAGSQPAEALRAIAESSVDAERLVITLALGRQRSPLVADMLRDSNERVRREAARLIWDIPIPEAYDELAAIIDDVPSTDEPLVRRVLAANVAQRTRQHLEQVVRFALRGNLPPAMRQHVWELIQHWSTPSPRDPVHGQWRPLEPVPPKQVLDVLQRALPDIIDLSDSDATGLVVAAELGVADALAPLMHVAQDGQQSQELRARAVAALGGADEATAAKALDAGLKSDVPAVRSAARQLLVKRFPERAVDELQTALSGGTIAEQQAALAMLAAIDSANAKQVIGEWLDRLEKNECPPELQLDVLEAAAASRDEGLIARQKAYLEQKAAAGAVASYEPCLVGGDAARGRKVFEENVALSCRRCHSLKPDETLVGPTLAGVGGKRSRAELLESLVAPNAKIVEGFQTTVMQLESGQVVSGILRREDEKHAVLVDAERNELTVNLDEVEDRFQGLSAMPEDLVKQMSRREVRDVVEFLSELK